ncbi:hypothetical protein CALCODRAFT_350010 [Calocera cornea HHB12733]|uniref:Uncharacterized protein n=1 Tax=Calocera cornea HHB12733 TaxID=1353952 RepID=A0A165ETR1_9BASI|nr:hypothetical protein CALCODRAFT_350010 [Calocera cornea HHB12733]
MMCFPKAGLRHQQPIDESLILLKEASDLDPCCNHEGSAMPVARVDLSTSYIKSIPNHSSIHLSYLNTMDPITTWLHQYYIHCIVRSGSLPHCSKRPCPISGCRLLRGARKGKKSIFRTHSDLVRHIECRHNFRFKAQKHYTPSPEGGYYRSNG